MRTNKELKIFVCAGENAKKKVEDLNLNYKNDISFFDYETIEDFKIEFLNQIDL